MIDSIKGITIIVTGSSSFDLVSHTGEPLVGRNIVYHLYPVAQSELSAIEDYLATLRNLEKRLIYGSYPELWHLDNQLEQENYLKQLVNSHLMKDILIYESIKGSDVLFRLLKLLAWQVGRQVNCSNLRKEVTKSKKRTYDGQEIDLLELYNGQLQAIECKWQNRKTKVPVVFSKAYPDANFTVISNENYLEWIT